MKRGEFLKEMTGSLFASVKSAYEPFMVEDLEKMEEAADRALGITWVPLMNKSELHSNLELKFLNGMPIVIFQKDMNVQAVSGICPECSSIIILTSQNSSGKCLNCEKEINFISNSGDLNLKSLPIKEKDHQYLIGLHKFNKNR